MTAAKTAAQNEHFADYFDNHLRKRRSRTSLLETSMMRTVR
jgi:hypothetical protein